MQASTKGNGFSPQVGQPDGDREGGQTWRWDVGVRERSGRVRVRQRLSCAACPL